MQVAAGLNTAEYSLPSLHRLILAVWSRFVGAGGLAFAGAHPDQVESPADEQDAARAVEEFE